MWCASRIVTDGYSPARVYLGLGTNLGDRKRNLRAALRRLGAVLEIDAVSSVYETEPVGYREQPDFWNLVVRGRTALEPFALLAAAQRIERQLGREPSFRNAPRVIDIDLLLYGDLRLVTSKLEVPHPRMLERAFVLRPLAEVEPGLRHPVTGERISERLAAVGAGLEHAQPLFPGTRLLERDAPPEGKAGPLGPGVGPADDSSGSR